MNLGDIRLGDTIDFKFTTRRFTTGAPFTLAGSPAVACYVGNGTTEITAGITLTVDFDSRTGCNHVRIVASSGNGFATTTDIQVVITAGTVDSVSVVGEVVATFSIEKRSALMPTTAGRTFDVSATGEGDANVVQFGGSAGTFSGGRPEVNVSHWLGTAAATPTVAGVPEVDVTHWIGTAAQGASGRPQVDVELWLGSAPNALVSGRVDSITNAIGANVITAAACADGFIDRASFAADTGLQTIRSNTLAGAGANDATLDAGAEADGFYNGNLLYITGGTGAGQIQRITGMTGQTCFVYPGWFVTPNATSTYAILPSTPELTAILEDTGTTIPGDLSTLSSAVAGIDTKIGTPADLGVGATLADNMTDLYNLAVGINVNVGDVPDLVWANPTRTITGGTIGTITGLTIANVENMATRFLGMIVLDGAVYQYTVNALELAPGGGGGSDWSATEKEHIRHRLGIDGTASAPSATPSLATAAAVTTVDTVVDGIAVDTATLLSRLTSTRAGYLDNLSAGPVALASALATVSTRVLLGIPSFAPAVANGLPILGDNTAGIRLHPSSGHALHLTGGATGDGCGLYADTDFITADGAAVMFRNNNFGAGLEVYSEGGFALEVDNNNSSPGVTIHSASGAAMQIGGGAGGPAIDIIGAGVQPGMQITGGSTAGGGHGLRINRGGATADDLYLGNSDAPTLAAAILDLTSGIETSITPRQALRALLSALAGNVTGGGLVYRAGANPATTRLTVVDDGGGNRTVTPSL